MGAPLVADIEDLTWVLLLLQIWRILHECSPCCIFGGWILHECSPCCRYRGTYMNATPVANMEDLT